MRKNLGNSENLLNRQPIMVAPMQDYSTNYRHVAFLLGALLS